MCKPPTPDAMAAPEEVDVKEMAPDAADAAPDADAEAEETRPHCALRRQLSHCEKDIC